MMPFKLSSGSVQPSTEVSLGGPLATGSNDLWNVLFRTYAAYQRQHNFDKFIDDHAQLIEAIGPLDACHYWLLKLEQTNHITTRLEETSLSQVKARLRLVLNTQPTLPLREYEYAANVEDVKLTTVLASFAALPSAQVTLHIWDKVDVLRAALLTTRLCVNRDYFPTKDMHLNPAKLLTQLHPLYAAPPVPLSAFAVHPPPSHTPYYVRDGAPSHCYGGIRGAGMYHGGPKVVSAPSWMSDDSRSDDEDNASGSGDDSLSGDDDDEYTLVNGKKK